MNTINKIVLKEEDYLKYYPTYFGYESKIYRLDSNTLLKVFNDRINNPNNKLKKLEILSQLDINENVFKDLVFVDGKFIGYTMEDLTKKGYRTINCCEHFSNKRIEISKLVWQRIEELHNLGIVYGDIREPNILYNGKNIIFCDMDNIKIQDYWFDIVSKINENYLYKTHFNYDFFDNYTFNIFFIGYYQKLHMPDLKYDDLEKRINNDECRKIAYEMAFLNENYTGKLFIDHLNDTFTTKLKRTLHK